MITIGLPFYNNERTLLDAIRSVFAQSVSDWELLLIDDGSVDGSLRIARSIADPRVQVLTDGENKGLAVRLNEIADLARGEFIARLDADDMMHPERLRAQLKYLEGHPDVDLVDTGLYAIDAAREPVGVRGVDIVEFSARSALGNRMLSHATILGRAEWFRANRYDERLPRCQDHELWCRTWRTSVFGRVSEPLYFCEETGGVRVRNYLRSCAVDLGIYMKYGPAAVGRRATARLVLGTVVKAACMRILGALKLEHVATSRRNAHLSEFHYGHAVAGLRRIYQASIPGLVDEDMGS